MPDLAPMPTVIPETTTEPRTMPLYRVLLHNDDVNDMDHVILAVQNVFGVELNQAIEIMWEAHTEGVALCTTEPLERAELHRDQLAAFSLLATIEPED